MIKILLIILTIFLLTINASCQPKDSTIVINIITDDTLNVCIDDTTFIHYIINYIPGDTVCNPVIISDTTKIGILWYGWEIDQELVNVRLPDGSFPHREDGSYYYLKQDSLGNLIPRRTIKPDGGTRLYISGRSRNTDFWDQ